MMFNEATMTWKISYLLAMVLAVAGASIAYGAGVGNQQLYSRPIPLGVDGANGLVNIAQNTGVCLFEDGTSAGW